MSQSLEDIISNAPTQAESNDVSTDNAEQIEEGKGESETESPSEQQTENQDAATTAPSAETDELTKLRKEIEGKDAAIIAERRKRQNLERQMSAPMPAGYSDDIDRFEHTMRELNDDYDEVMDGFYSHIDNEDDGTTLDELRSAKNPVVYAYKKGQEIAKAKREKSEQEAKAKEEALRAQIRAEVQAELTKNNTPAYPPSLPSGGSPAQMETGEHKSLEEIIGR